MDKRRRDFSFLYHIGNIGKFKHDAVRSMSGEMRGGNKKTLRLSRTAGFV